MRMLLTFQYHTHGKRAEAEATLRKLDPLVKEVRCFLDIYEQLAAAELLHPISVARSRPYKRAPQCPLIGNSRRKHTDVCTHSLSL